MLYYPYIIKIMKTSSAYSSTDKSRDNVIFRVNFINQLLQNKTLTPLIDFNRTDTEYYKYGDVDDDKLFNNDTGSNDTRRTIKKTVRDFSNMIKHIGGTLYYIKSGTTGHTFKSQYVDNGQVYNYGVKVVAYPKKAKYGNIYDSSRPENAEIVMLRVLSYFIVNKKTQHIVLPIATFNCDIKTFVSLYESKVITEADKKYMEFIEKYKDGEFHDDVSILLSEWANSGDLLDFIRKNFKKMKLLDWKVIFFQIISALAVIQNTYPSFRHNDLKANNVLLHQISKERKSYSYFVLKQKYIIPNIGYLTKLWDYDFACIPGIVDNKKVLMEWAKTINVTPTEHKYYDIHYFFNTLAFAGFFPQMMVSEYIPNEVKKFVKFVVPRKYRSVYCPHKNKDERCKKCHINVHQKGRLLVDDEYLTPESILSNEFFDEFRILEKK